MSTDSGKTSFIFANQNYSSENESIVIDSENMSSSGVFCLLSTRYNGVPINKPWGDTEITVKNGTVQNIATYWLNYHPGTPQSIKKNFTVNIDGGIVNYLNLGAFAHQYVLRHSGDIVYNINGGTVKTLKLEDTSHSYFTAKKIDTDGDGTADASYRTEGRLDEISMPSGNIAVVIDSSKATINQINQYYLTDSGGNPYSYEEASAIWKKLDDKKRFALVFNNYDKAIKTFNLSNYRLEHFDYKLLVEGGVAEPVYKEATLGDPSTSYLQGFKITSNKAGFIPVINSTRLKAVALPAGTYSVSGKDVTVSDGELSVYPLEDFTTLGTNDAITVSFIDERIPVVYGTEADLEGIDQTVYAPVTTFPAAFEMLGTTGGTIYVKGTVAVSDGIMESDAYDNRGPVTITAYGNDATAGKVDIAAWVKAIKGDLTYKDITLNNTAAYALFSYGHTLTLDTVKNDSAIYVGNKKESVSNIVNIKNTTVAYASAVIAMTDHNQNTSLSGNTIFNIYEGANVQGLNLSASSAGDFGNDSSTGTIKGDFIVNLDGGTTGTISAWGGIGNQYQRNIRFAGDTIFNLKSGKQTSTLFSLIIMALPLAQPKELTKRLPAT